MLRVPNVLCEHRLKRPPLANFSKFCSDFHTILLHLTDLALRQTV